MSKFKEQFKKEITKKLTERLNVKNPMGVPRLVKIVVNESTKDFLADKKNLEKAAEDLVLITGQKPKVARARVSVATFKLRKGDEIGLVVTLRGARMYDFFEKIVKIVLPRVRGVCGMAAHSSVPGWSLRCGNAGRLLFPEIDSG